MENELKLTDFIEEACEIMNEHPTIKKVVIEGEVTTIVIDKSKNDDEK